MRVDAARVDGRLEELLGRLFPRLVPWKLEGNLRDRPEKLEGQAPRKAYFTRVCDSRRRQRSWQHCQQLGDLLRVAGGVGRDATAEAVDGRAKAVQLDVVDSRIVDVGWLCRNRSCIRHEGWLVRGCVAVEGRLWMGLRFPMVIGVGRRLCSGWKNGCG